MSLRVVTMAEFLGAGALFNAVNLAAGGDYKGFADHSYIPFIHHTWRSIVDPHVDAFIPLPIAFEAAVGLLVLSGGRRTQLGLVGAIGFEVALVLFGWAFAARSIPTILALALLLQAERKHAAALEVVETQLRRVRRGSLGQWRAEGWS